MAAIKFTLTVTLYFKLVVLRPLLFKINVVYIENLKPGK